MQASPLAELQPVWNILILLTTKFWLALNGHLYHNHLNYGQPERSKVSSSCVSKGGSFFQQFSHPFVTHLLHTGHRDASERSRWRSCWAPGTAASATQEQRTIFELLDNPSHPQSGVIELISGQSARLYIYVPVLLSFEINTLFIVLYRSLWNSLQTLHTQSLQIAVNLFPVPICM